MCKCTSGPGETCRYSSKQVEINKEVGWRAGGLERNFHQTEEQHQRQEMDVVIDLKGVKSGPTFIGGEDGEYRW